ncbi:MAG: MFS transporter [Hyphomonadaceae bacterium]|nr:MFS transporter [Hyphomonadaceae bacterium]
MLSAFRSFRVYNYRLWAAGALVSNFGTWIQRTAQDWLVLTELTDKNASALGIVVACQFAPQLLLLPWTGFAADYFDRRKLLMVTQGLMATLSLLLGVLTVTGLVELWHVYVLAFLLGATAAFDAPVRHAFVGELVGDHYLSNAVALNSTSFNTARLAGPAAAGFFIAAVGIGWAFLINGFSFLAVLASLFFMRLSLLRERKRASRAKGTFLAGFGYAWRRQDLRLILIMLFLIGTFGFNFPIFISTMAVSVYQTDAQGFGMLASFIAVGTLVGAILAAGRRMLGLWSLVFAAMFFSAGCLAAAFSPGYWWFAAALVMIGLAAITFMTTTNSIMQLTTEPEMRGRMMALRVAIALGGIPIGAPIAGWVADQFGPRWALGLGAASALAAGLMGAIYLLRSKEAVALSRSGSSEAGAVTEMRGDQAGPEL